MSLSDAELERYARHIVLPQVGGVGQRKLKASSVAVVGAGAIGSAAIPALAGAGVGRITIIDDDVIELSNLHRQLMYREDQVGELKAVAAARHARSRNSLIEVRAHTERISTDNACELLTAHTLVIDGSDNFATRLTVNSACVQLGIPLVSAAAAQVLGQIGLFRGHEPDQPCYRCFVGDAFDSEDCDNCADLGVLGALTGTVGNFAVLLAVGELLGAGSGVAGKLFLLDAHSLVWRTMQLPIDVNCNTCGGQRETGS